jgi:hypothetical protein
VSLPLRIAVCLGLPLVFIAALAVLAWADYSGSSNGLLIAGAIVAGLAAVIGFPAFVLWQGMSVGLTVLAALPVAGMLLTLAAGVAARTLHDHGHDVACRITTISRVETEDGPHYDFGLNCDGSGPSTIDQSTLPPADAAVGKRIVLRHDPVGGGGTVVASDLGDGQGPLIACAAFAGALLLTCLAVGVRRRSE